MNTEFNSTYCLVSLLMLLVHIVSIAEMNKNAPTRWAASTWNQKRPASLWSGKLPVPAERFKESRCKLLRYIAICFRRLVVPADDVPVYNISTHANTYIQTRLHIWNVYFACSCTITSICASSDTMQTFLNTCVDTSIHQHISYIRICTCI